MSSALPPTLSRKRERGKYWVISIIVLCVVALFADVLASDLPLIGRADGQLFILPCVTKPTPPTNWEWKVRTPIPYGPLQTLATTGEMRDEPPPWAPDEKHWLGTDELGRDVAARIIHGARVSLFVAFFTMIIAAGLGLIIGGISGYFGGAIDAVLSRVLEVMQTFPLVFFLLALSAVLRTQSLLPLIIALGLTRWTDVARLVRAEILSLKTREFVLAARAQGASGTRIIFKHLIPNSLGPVLITTTFGVGSAILLETALSFLGVGVAPPTASWGELLTEAHRNLQHTGAWWLAVFPGLMIMITVLTVNGLAEARRAAK
jgi:peptide/nickel transport system permease protein